MNPSGWKCPRRAGFLFPHECDRDSAVGCPDCDNGQVADPFAQRTDRYSYLGYDQYHGLGPAGQRNPNDFTEADGEKLVRSRKKYEDDMTAS
ncbi:MAG: hypothetical protein ABSE86_30710 [Bryobacteraceae bacterium]|jgi:hypothetical protein